jgi:hypothetical protein
MDSRKEPESPGGPGAARPASKAWTAIRHSSALVAFLGLFVALSAYATDPRSEMITAGWIMIGLGVVGFLAGWLASRRG